MTVFKIYETVDITYNWLYLQLILLKTVNKKQICNVAFVNTVSKVIISKVIKSIVVVSSKLMCLSLPINSTQFWYFPPKVVVAKEEPLAKKDGFTVLKANLRQW